MDKKLSGKVALITGGTAGIGAATARLFAQEGARVAITGRNADAGAEVASLIEQAGGEALYIRCDVRQPDDCQWVVDETLRRFGQIDILFNNAGIVPMGTVLEISLETWQDAFSTNVSGVFYMCKMVLPHMIERSQGVIVNNASDWAILGGQGAAAYCATKGAVAQLTRCLALDHARQGIRVNAVCPGDTYVDRWKSKWQVQDDAELQARLDKLGQDFPLGRVGTAEEIGRAVLFLASGDSSYMTGQMLVVDGGNTAGGVATRY
jgi:meso-butanediol dehydrogenase / (S,S)-butanediol dehydrogenase / diacetyl reductase